MSLTKNDDIDKLFHFLSVCILIFINEGSTSFSDAFAEEPWSWGLTVPISLYFKFALELHAHLGICVGVGLPSLVYWGITRNSMDWYTETILDFNIELLKTGLFNLFIGLAHWVIMKLLHHFHDWVKQNKRFYACWPIVSKFFEATAILEHPLLRPVSAKETFLQLLELLCIFFYNGNVMLLSWGFSGNEFSSEVGKAISWISLGSAMHVWMKACLKVLEVQPAAPAEEKAHKGAKVQPSDQSLESKDQLQVVTLPKC